MIVKNLIKIYIILHSDHMYTFFFFLTYMCVIEENIKYSFPIGNREYIFKAHRLCVTYQPIFTVHFNDILIL